MEAINAIPAALSGKGSSEKVWTLEIEKKSEDESRSSTKFGLGITAGSVQKPRMREFGDSQFSPSQVHELHLQFVALEHIAASRPLPPHLLLALGSCIHHCGLKAGRCRRTDGKKWRCRRDAVAQQRYCERHMHRGRKCSGKLVESSLKSYNQKMNIGVASPSSGNATNTTYASSSRTIGNEGTTGIYKIVNQDEQNKRSTNRDSLAWKSIKGQDKLSYGINFSPRKNTLAGDCSESFSGGGGQNAELERCKRTDGKRWRCRKVAVPGQKYCPKHMHRGSKRYFRASEPISSFNPPAPAKHSCLVLKTNLSISVAAGFKSSKVEDRGERAASSGNSSVSTETTISDISLPRDGCVSS